MEVTEHSSDKPWITGHFHRLARERQNARTGGNIWGYGGKGGIRLIVGFQPLMVISPTASWIRWCMQVYAWRFNVDLSCLGRTFYARQFWVPIHQFNSATGEQQGIIQTIYTDSEPPSRMPNSLTPSANLRSTNLPFFPSLV